MRSGFHLRLSHKIVAIGFVGIAGLLAFGAIYWTASRSQEVSRAIADNARGISNLNEKLSVELLETRRSEKDFQLRRDESYAKHHAELSASIGRDLAQLKASLQALNSPELPNKAVAIEDGFKKYLGNFTALVQAEIALGLSEEAGLSGTLRNAVHDIEAKLNKLDNPRLTSGMLMMRRHEKDYMLRRNPKYVGELKKTVAEFSATLAASDIDAATKADIGQHLDKYQKGFLAWADGAADVTGKAAAMSKAFHDIEPIIAQLQQGIEQVQRDAVTAETGVRESAKMWLLIAFGLMTVVVGAASTLTGRSISKALSGLTSGMKELAEGNFGVVLPGLDRKDEVGEIAQAVEAFKVKAQEKARLEAEAQRQQENLAAEQRKADMIRLADSFEGAVGEIIETVSSASTELEASAGTLTSTAVRAQELTTAVAAASEEASTNVQSVASATEEMASSVNEISRQVQESARIAGEAVEQAQKTNERVGELSKAASRIGDVVELINTIAGQTNLLALNATIEAARAGEAGRGFAVVASEVKALAEQTAKATGEITQQIKGIQDATDESVVAIKEIGGTIGRMSEIASTIAAAVEEQGAATQEISRNVQQAAQGTQQVSSNITDVQRGASETGTASSQVLSAAQSLSSESNRLKLEVGKFLNTVRVA